MAKEYNINKTLGRCHLCQKELLAGEEFVAAVTEEGEELRRDDYCAGCWDAAQKEQSLDEKALAVWRTVVPPPAQKKKTFVDDELIINFFERLADADDQVKLGFRYVLALVLMRKRLLVYDRMEKQDSKEIWQMHLRGTEQVHKVIDPKMDEATIAEVSSQLGQILEGQL